MPKGREIWVTTGDSMPSKLTMKDTADIDDLSGQLSRTNIFGESKDIGKANYNVKLCDGTTVKRNVNIFDLPSDYDNPLRIEIKYATTFRPDNNFLITPSCQNAASTAANGNLYLSGFGSLPTSFRVDATDDCVVWSELCPTDAEISVVNCDMPLIGELMGMIPRGEDPGGGVDAIFASEQSLFSSFCNGSTSLKSLNLEVGIALTRSKCDHILGQETLHPGGFIELKGGNHSLTQGNRQSAMYGTHFAIGLLNRGVPREKIIVPSYTYNGMIIQFGATIVLAPSFPVFWTISEVLDMSSASRRRLAAAYIRKANIWIKKLRLLDTSLPIEAVTAMEFDESAYHIKRITNNVASRGFGLFSERETDISQGIEHWGRVLNVLFEDINIRPHVAFPLAIRTPNKSLDDYIIIYKDLCREDYRIGCPNRVDQEEMYIKYRDEFIRIMKLVHDAGVIHCDLYLSNVMWRINESDNIDIVIIDWDCAHCLIEGRFYPKVLEAQASHKPTRSAVFGRVFDERYIAVLSIELCESDREMWIDLASGEKEKVDDAFFGLFSQM
jgi:hypothetical protein